MTIPSSLDIQNLATTRRVRRSEMSNDAKENIDDTLGAGTTNKTEGNAKDLKGRVKEAAGAVTGNDSLRADGVKDQAEGRVQHGVGKAEGVVEKVKDAIKGKND